MFNKKLNSITKFAQKNQKQQKYKKPTSFWIRLYQLV